MTRDEIKHVTELAMIRSIPDLMVDKPKQGRLKNLMSKLQGAVDSDLDDFFRNPKAADMVEVKNTLDEFKRIARFGKQKHIGTITSFCLSIIENSDKKFNKRIVECLNAICDYYERVGDLHAASMWSGDLACERWNSMFK